MPKKQKTSDGRCRIRIYLGVKDGKRQYKSVYGKTQREAEKKAQNVRNSLLKGIDVMAERDSFSKWAESWIDIKSSEVSDSWHENLKSIVKGIQSSDFCSMPIIQLRTNDIQSFLLNLAKKNPKTNRPTAYRTLKMYKDVIQQICQLAIDNRVMDYNPAGPVKVPNKKEKTKRRALTKEEQQWILDTPHRAKLPAMIMMYVGLRRGEMIPLTWADIDLKSKTIRINKSVEMRGSASHLKPYTKTQAGMRTVPIPEVLLSYLSEEKKSAKTLLVCPTETGNMMSNTSWRRMWDSYLIDLNFKYGNRMTKKGKIAKSKFNPEGLLMTIPNITAHWLRHTYATMLYLADVDILTAKSLLGHEDIKTTLEIYTHLDQEYKDKNISKLNEYLSKTS